MRRLLLLALLLTATTAFAQSANTSRGFDPQKAYAIGEIDHVNLFNGNAIITLPIGPTYPVGGALSYRFTLVYNGNDWDFLGWMDGVHGVPDKFSNAGLGWRLSLGELIAPQDPLNGSGTWIYGSPDGAQRSFHRTLHKEEDGNSAYEAAASPAANGVVGYTRDGSYLRMKRLAPQFVRTETAPDGEETWVWLAQYQIELADGTIHTFESEEIIRNVSATPTALHEQAARYRLTRIADRFDNAVTVAYDNETWTVSDTTGRTHTITLVPQTYYQYRGTTQSRHLVSTVALAAFDGSTATYTFQYGGYERISEPCGDSVQNNEVDGAPKDRDVYVRFLTSVGLPDGTTWSMPSHVGLVFGGAGKVVCQPAAGHLTQLVNPLGGRLEYELEGRGFPHLVEQQGGAFTVLQPHVTSSAAIKKRRIVTGTQTAEWTYTAHFRNTADVQSSPGGAIDSVARELVLVATDPIGNSTVHFFNVLLAGDDECYGPIVDGEYGLPFTRSANSGVLNLLRSTESYAGTCATWETTQADGCQTLGKCKSAGGVELSPQQRTYVAYEVDERTTHAEPGNARVKASRTEHVQDTSCGSACYVESVYDQFDGLGHYRKETRSSNFPSTATRTLVTQYNANLSEGIYTPGASSAPSSYMIAASAAWILNLYDESSVTENGVTAIEELCFDRTNAFLQRKRTRAAASAGSTDLLAVFTHSGGNVTAEEYYGGDKSPLAAGFATCSGTPATRDYKIVHTFSSGVRATTKHDGVSFFDLDLTIDANTGLVAKSRDTEGLETSFDYDTSGRLTEIHPPGEAWTKIDYPTRAAQVRRFAVGTNDPPLTEQWFHYDSSGRLIQSKERWPANWRTATTTYDLLGRVARTYVPEYRSTPAYESTTPLHYSENTYDLFGRVTSVRAPDQSQTSTTYTGARLETTSVAGILTEKTYDGHGRLIAVKENAGDEANAVTATYQYDVGNRLKQVLMHNQLRVFTYDQRGFLTSEQHPELGAGGNGMRTYPTYDARGHARRVITGGSSAFDLTYDYDAAERITKVTSGTKTLKELVYSNGRLSEAKRTNHDDVLGAVTVTETYQYNGVGGRPSRRDLTIGSTASLAGASFFFTQAYNNLGLVSSITYPCVTGAPCDRTPPTVSYTYDRGMLTSVGGWASSITYQANGLVSSVAHSSGITESWTADPHGMARPRAIAVAPYWTSGNYQYDAAGNITAIGDTVYTYDAFHRLTQATTDQRTETGGNVFVSRRWQKRAYDLFGNVTHTSAGGWSSTSADDSGGAGFSGDRQVSGTSNRYIGTSYDAAGNVTFESGRTFGYDPLNMATHAFVNGREYRYLYSANDERVGVVERVTTMGGPTVNRPTWTIRGFANELLSVWKNGAWSSDQIRRGSQLLGENTPTGPRHFSLDHLGSPRVITDAAGNLVGGGLQSFDPFGLGGTSDGGPLQYTGHERDAALVGGGDIHLPDYLHARYYDAGGGRFLGVDPVLDVKKATHEPQLWNRYAYVTNNPLTYSDPDGQERLVSGAALPSETHFRSNAATTLQFLRKTVRYDDLRDAFSGFGSAPTNEKLLAAGIGLLAGLEIGSNFLAPEKAPAGVLLGENMVRVVAVAGKLELGLFRKTGSTFAETMAMNMRWLADQASSGTRIFDIGLDASRGGRSGVFFRAEVAFMEKLGYKRQFVKLVRIDDKTYRVYEWVLPK